MDKSHNAADCILGLVIVAATFALGYAAIATLFQNAVLASGLH